MISLNPGAIAPPFGQYSHGVEIPPGAHWVRTSGQLGLSVSGEVPEGVSGQARICFENIDAILAEAGMGRKDVVHISAYVTDRSFMADYMARRDHWLAGVDVLPSSTLMIVSGFTRPEFVVEIEVWAAKA